MNLRMASCMILMLALPFIAKAQFAEQDDSKGLSAPAAKGGNLAFKPVRPMQSKEETLDITGFGTPVIAVSNTADGTAKSYQHSFRVTYPLLIAGGKSGYFLVFYGDSEAIPYAVQTESTGISVYFPYVAHEQIKNKIEQSLLARKKVQLKVTQKVEGYREAVLSFN